MTAFIVCSLLAGCAKQPPAPVEPQASVIPDAPASWQASAMGKRVLIIWNKAVPDGGRLALYYASKRGIPKGNILMVHVIADEEMNVVELQKNVYPAVREAAKGKKIDFIALMKGMPIRVWDDAHFSVDAYISTMDKTIPPMRQLSTEGIQSLANPYYGKNEAFSRDKYGFYLVTRLDGYSFADAKRLVDNASAARREEGLFLFDKGGGRSEGSKGELDDTLVRASKILVSKGLVAQTEETAEFVSPARPLAGYCSWGSNDTHFSDANYQRLSFKPGAIAETFVSTSARTFKPTSGGQSLIADLIAHGVTGVKGYVKEPFTFAMAHPDILFDRYTTGYTLAESYYMASPVIKWRDLIVGDPLCAPYKPIR